MKKVLKNLGKGLGFLLLLPLLYLLIATVGILIPVNSGQEPKREDVRIYIKTNAVHTSFLLPLDHELSDWTAIVNSEHVLAPDKPFEYISFGWGDLEFYQNTPQWGDLSFTTAFRALFLKTPSAIQVEFYEQLPKASTIFPVDISREEYSILTNYIIDSFNLGTDGNPIVISGLHYSQHDVFYQAQRHLNLFYTCNTWTNNGLKETGLEASLWTPFEEGVLYRYQ